MREESESAILMGLGAKRRHAGEGGGGKIGKGQREMGNGEDGRWKRDIGTRKVRATGNGVRRLTARDERGDKDHGEKTVSKVVERGGRREEGT